MDVTILPLSLCQFVSSSPSSRTCKTADNQRENNLTHTGLLLSRHKNHVLGGAINNKTCTSSRQCQSPSQYICSELLSGCYGGQQPALASKDTHHQSELSQLSPLLGAGRGAFTRSGDTGLAGRAPGGDTGCCTGCLCTSSGDTPAAALPAAVQHHSGQVVCKARCASGVELVEAVHTWVFPPLIAPHSDQTALWRHW